MICIKFVHENKYIEHAVWWLNRRYAYSEAPDVNVSVLNGYPAVTGDGENFGFAVYIPKQSDFDTPCIEVAGDVPWEIVDGLTEKGDIEAAERDFYVGNLFHEVAHHFQKTGYRIVDKDLIETDAEQFSDELLETYNKENGYA